MKNNEITPAITVFTATYNRGYKISALYKSLLEQTYQDFEWIIVDDGSTDATNQIISEFRKQSKLNIQYYYKENEGKHIAINYGAERAKGKWYFIVDSDDILVPTALQTIQHYCLQIEDNQDFAGVAGLRANRNGDVWGSDTARKDSKKTNDMASPEKEYIDATPITYRYGLKIKGDKAEVIKTKILRNYQFPSFPGEKFMPERFLWYSLSKDKYQLRWFNKVIYITEYLEDGLTKNGRQMARESCRSRSWVDHYSLGMKGIPIIHRYKYAINALRYGRLSGRTWRQLFADSHHKLFYLSALPLAIILRIK
jgi:Glycosyltransferases involved in cell wall biogenesis